MTEPKSRRSLVSHGRILACSCSCRLLATRAVAAVCKEVLCFELHVPLPPIELAFVPAMLSAIFMSLLVLWSVQDTPRC